MSKSAAQKPYRVLLYYKYTSVEKPEELLDSQRALCARLGILGRIFVGPEGINGTCAGTVEATEAYKEAMKSDPRFADMVFKEDESDTLPFRKLKIKVRDEIVALGMPEATPEIGGTHIGPDEWHEMIQRDDVVVLDGRNAWEARIGKFKNALVPDVDYFREFPEWVEKNADKLKGKKVAMYCNGGIRCERASAVVKLAGVEEVYQLDGGIVSYTKEHPDGMWEGSLFVFDDRRRTQLNDDAHHEVISACEFCDTPTDYYENCCNAECNELILLCDSCKENSNRACSEECSKKHRDGIVKTWNIKTRRAE